MSNASLLDMEINLDDTLACDDDLDAEMLLDADWDEQFKCCNDENLQCRSAGDGMGAQIAKTRIDEEMVNDINAREEDDAQSVLIVSFDAISFPDNDYRKMLAVKEIEKLALSFLAQIEDVLKNSEAKDIKTFKPAVILELANRKCGNANG